MALKQHAVFLFRRIVRPSLLDWILIIVLLGAAGGLFAIHPFRRPFSITDVAISLPYLEDTISVPALIGIAVVLPAVVILLLCTFIAGAASASQNRLSLKERWRFVVVDLHSAWLSLAVAIAFSLVLTQLLKNLFGKHRPDFLARCDPDLANYSKYLVGGYSSEALEGTSQLVNWQICLSKNGTGVGTAEFLDGFRSFPSGHCTIAFAGLAFLGFFIYTKTGHHLKANITNSNGDPVVSKAVLIWFAIVAPFLVATYIASTRFTDNKHAGFDILFGSVEGIVCAYISMRWFYRNRLEGYAELTMKSDEPTAFSSGALTARHEPTDLERNIELRNLDTIGPTNGSYESQRPSV